MGSPSPSFESRLSALQSQADEYRSIVVKRTPSLQDHCTASLRYDRVGGRRRRPLLACIIRKLVNRHFGTSRIVSRDQQGSTMMRRSRAVAATKFGNGVAELIATSAPGVGLTAVGMNSGVVGAQCGCEYWTEMSADSRWPSQNCCMHPALPFAAIRGPKLLGDPVQLIPVPKGIIAGHRIHLLHALPQSHSRCPFMPI